MSTSEILENLRSRILSGYTLLFLKSWEEERWENELAQLALEMEWGLVTWSMTMGPQPPISQADAESGFDLCEFLDQVASYPPQHVFLIKDITPHLRDPAVLRKLRDVIPTLNAQQKILLCMGPELDIPVSLQKEAVQLELPLPGSEELREVLHAVIASEAEHTGSTLELNAAEEERLVKSMLGLTIREATKALTRALHGHDRFDDEIIVSLVSEKKRMVQGSDLVEFYELEEGVKDIGGLEMLKEWIAQRSEAFSSRAREKGIPVPKGVLLLGVQGCGKSLTCRATARLLGFPLVRLDVSSLLSSDRGSSEKNMRDVLHLMETIAPAVLWLDEIEKGFAGSDQSVDYDSTMSRLMGRFLTWMDERHAAVFVVATANSVTSLPPELLRRGRFDELFFIDLPNYYERRQILGVHLVKRGWKPEKFDVPQLAERTEGYSGAELEQIIVAAMLDSYGKGQLLSQQALELARENTVPLSVTMEEKIFELREWARTRCRPATPDSRVMQMMDEEHRREEEADAVRAANFREEWQVLAEHGQLPAAITEFVRTKKTVTFPDLEDAFAQWQPTTGDQGLALRSDPNTVLWVGMSPELAGTLVKLIAEKKLYIHEIDPDIAESTPRKPKLPTVRKLTEDRLPRPCWFPAVLCAYAPEEINPRLSRVARMKLSN
ncbi:MAG: AAA family ATPase [Planctomycetaceae bacterium]